MPELPDVEVFRKYMDASSLHQQISGVEVKNEKVLQDTSPSGLGRKLNGRQFLKTKRHGKHMFACVDGEFWIMFHFGMTGFLKYYKNSEDRPEHTQILFSFENGYHLAYDNQRMLGKVQIVDSAADYIRKNNLGSDALDLSLNGFRQ